MTTWCEASGWRGPWTPVRRPGRLTTYQLEDLWKLPNALQSVWTEAGLSLTSINKKHYLYYFNSPIC